MKKLFFFFVGAAVWLTCLGFPYEKSSDSISYDEVSGVFSVNVSCGNTIKIYSLNSYGVDAISTAIEDRRWDLSLDFPNGGYREWGCLHLDGAYYLVLKGWVIVRLINDLPIYSECIKVFSLKDMDYFFSCDEPKTTVAWFDFLYQKEGGAFHKSFELIKGIRFQRIF